jgi:hypothetical protein
VAHTKSDSVSAHQSKAIANNIVVHRSAITNHMFGVMGQWMSGGRPFTVTEMRPEQPFDSKFAHTFTIATNEDVEEKIAELLGTTRAGMCSVWNPHNSLHFFYSPPAPAPPGGGAGGEFNMKAHGLMIKGAPRNEQQPRIYGYCYVCKHFNNNELYGSCFPYDIFNLTGEASRFEKKSPPAAKPRVEEKTTPPPPAAEPLVEEKVPSAPDVLSRAVEKTSPPVAKPRAEEKTPPPAAKPQAVEEKVPPKELSKDEKPPQTTMSEISIVLTDVPERLWEARDTVYRAILLDSVRGGGKHQETKEEEDEHPAVALTELSDSIPTQQKTVKKKRTRVRNDVSEGNIIPEGVRRSARLRTKY